jgi:3-methyl-2-oxobutanoate hydroxymethyltransferase
MRKTISEFKQMKTEGRKISMLTAYDASMARLLDSCGVVDMLLVGDSLGMVMLGYDSTVPVSMEEMLHHAKAVRRGAPEAFVVGDMPFGAYQTGERDAIVNGLRFMKEAGCDAVKLEGGLAMCSVVRALVDAGIPVMAHIGLTPQTAGQLGGYKLQGKDLGSARRLLMEGRGLQEAGAFAVVMECIPAGLAQVITGDLAIPTIGIGAGVHCDGQVLVTHDLLGMFEKFIPKFVKKYSDLAPVMKDCIVQYDSEVKGGAFPGPEYGFAGQGDYTKILIS